MIVDANEAEEEVLIVNTDTSGNKTVKVESTKLSPFAIKRSKATGVCTFKSESTNDTTLAFRCNNFGPIMCKNDVNCTFN